MKKLFVIAKKYCRNNITPIIKKASFDTTKGCVWEIDDFARIEILKNTIFLTTVAIITPNHTQKILLGKNKPQNVHLILADAQIDIALCTKETK